MNEPPFPWTCHSCFEQRVALTQMSPFRKFVRFGPTKHLIVIPVIEIPVCRACGNKVFTREVDDQINQYVHQTMKWWNVRVLTESCQGATDYRVRAVHPMDARVIAFAMDGGFPSRNTQMAEGDDALVELYTGIIE